MFRMLFVNTAVSGLVFAVSSVLVLLLVPILLGAYGASGLGLIMLARAFLPTGLGALFDLGVSEVVAQAVARARESKEWSTAGGQVTLLAGVALLVGGLLGAGLWGYAGALAEILRVNDSQSSSFAELLQLTGVALVLLFPALVAEGVVKGFEAYWALRLAELVPTVGYVLGSVALVEFGYGYQAVALMFLGSILLRALITIVIAINLSLRANLRMQRCARLDRADALERCRLMFAGKAVTALQTQAPPLAIGALIGPAGVGVYDVLSRLPRFAKSILGLLTSLLTPISARLDEARDTDGQRRLGSAGVLLVPLLVIPVLGAAALLSAPLLGLWLGPEYRSLWGWHSAMFLVTTLASLVSFASVVVMVRKADARRVIRMTAVMVMAQYGISLIAVGLLQERAFILGQVLAAVMVFPFQLRFLLLAQGVPMAALVRLLASLIAMSVSVAVVAPIVVDRIQDLLTTLLVGACWAIAWWLLLTRVLLTGAQRRAVSNALNGLLASGRR